MKYYIQKKETETPKMQFFYKGKKYKSVSACCAEYGVNASSVRNRAKTTECSIEESLEHFIKKARMETQPSVFIFRDKTYSSLDECCLEYGVNADSVSSRKYRLNCTMEESLEHFIENKDMIAERIQKFTFKGIEYRSLRACCQKYGIDDICVRQRARDKNCSLEESFTHFMTRKRKKMLSNPEFEYHGTVYPSLKVCCEELGINKSSVINRLYMLRKKTQPEANNDKILISVKEACELTGLSEKTMRSLMKENCFMVRIGRRTLIDKKKFQKWIDRQS